MEKAGLNLTLYLSKMMRDTAGLFEKGFSANAFNSGKLYFGIR